MLEQDFQSILSGIHDKVRPAKQSQVFFKKDSDGNKARRQGPADRRALSHKFLEHNKVYHLLNHT
jgi:hypothetical protein